MKERTSIRKALSVLMAAILATLFMLPGSAFAEDEQQKVFYDATSGYQFPDGEQTKVEAFADGYTVTKEIPESTEIGGTYIVPLLFDGNGGKIDGSATKEGRNMHSTGMQFAKWEDPDHNTWFPGDLLTKPAQGDLTLTATYAPSHKVVADKFPGKDSTVRDGFVLIGWTDALEGSENLYAPGESVPETAEPVAGEDYAVFYAVWAPAVTVTFVNGVTGEVIGTDVIEKGSGAKAPAVPEMEGYVFVEWDKPFAEVDEDLTVTAVYKEAEAFYKAIFDSNGATGINDPAYLIFEKSAGLELPKCTLSRDGYEFAGWSLAKDGSGDVYAAGTKLEGLDKSADDEGTVIFYAQWKKVVPEKAVPKTGLDGTGDAIAICAAALALAALGFAAARRRAE